MFIKVKNLSLTYTAQNLDRGYLRKRIYDKINSAIKGKKKIEDKKIQALNNINFELKPGDKLGVIGPNGSGKSTLLKCLSGIILPNKESELSVDGSVLPILEPSSLAEPMDSVINNIYLIGLIYGFSREQIEKKIDDILKFSELSDFQNIRYSNLSTGMKLKLVFAIVNILNSEIFIIDEFLTTGDEKFRQKGFQLLNSSRGLNNITIICSHERPIINEFCNKLLVLSKGEQIYFGDIDKGFEIYNNLTINNI